MRESMATIPRVVTYEEWLTMPVVQDGVDEVVKGKYRFTPPTRYPHADIIQRILVRMAQQLDESKVTILGSNFGLVIGRILIVIHDAENSGPPHCPPLRPRT